MTILNNLKLVNERIKKSCAMSNVDLSKIKILAVSKKMGTNKIFEAHQAGLNIFGENYISESIEKINYFKKMGLNFQWHFIGPIQSNKTKSIAENFDWVHSVSTPKTVKRLIAQRPVTSGPLNIFVQVNLSNEKNKSGTKVEEVRLILKECTEFERIKVRGLMTIPENTSDNELIKKRFKTLVDTQRELKLDFAIQNPTVFIFDMISMGMSSDMDLAISESDPSFTTIVRLGTSIFGKRT
ncbi:YggS family pyridoxal phosphate-dependent enzyme [Betaproteobacteria bacterium]|nr:YggS family pyridoxal phosphate-dependent enzyme [Betaproteobacteria bacterium]